MQRHRFDLFSFVFGVLFLAIAGFAAFRDSVDARVDVWLWPAVLVLLGLALLGSAWRAGRRTPEDGS